MCEHAVNWLLLWLGLPHRYVSTGCLHGTPEGHHYCRSNTGLSGAKRPGTCKHCSAPCRCRCHRRQPTPQPAPQVREPAVPPVLRPAAPQPGGAGA